MSQIWSSKVHRHLLFCTGRNISLTAAVTANHYDILGITPKATQAEVKAAYYKLSKLHHPDTNFKKEGDNGDKFRLISEAYEVLGNYRSRQLYDKGLYGHSRRAEEDRTRKDTTPDHPNMAFYKSRFDKSRVPTTQMGKGVYNFDEWTRQHYSETFAKVNSASKAKRKQDDSNTHPHEITSNEILLKLSGAAIFAAVISFVLMDLVGSNFDSPRSYDQNRDKKS